MKCLCKSLFFILIMSFGLSSNAEYTAKIFIDGLSVKSNITNPPAIIEDGDETIQEGGESGELTFTVSRTSGYNHNSFILTVTSNIYNCFNIKQEYVLGRSPNEYCGESYSFVENLDLSTAIPGIYTFQLNALDEYGGAALKSYTFDLEILAIDDDEESDSELSFGFYRKVIEQGGVFSVNINSSTFNCYEINILTDGYGTWESGCPSDGYPYATTVDLTWDFPEFFGNLEMEIVGYNIDEVTWEKIDEKSYPFSVTVNEGSNIPEISSFRLESEMPSEYITFYAANYDDSRAIGNYVIFFAGKAKEYRLDVPSISYSTGWLDINSYSAAVTEYALGDPIISTNGGEHEATLSVRNGSNVETLSRNLNLGATGISNINFNLCNSDSSTCYGQSMAIWDGGTGDFGSIIFQADNTDCMTIQSDEDPEFNTPQTKCYYNGGGDRLAVFYVNYPNHDPVGRSSKVYNYNYTATNNYTGQVVNGVFPVTIYYD